MPPLHSDAAEEKAVPVPKPVQVDPDVKAMSFTHVGYYYYYCCFYCNYYYDY